MRAALFVMILALLCSACGADDRPETATEPSVGTTSDLAASPTVPMSETESTSTTASAVEPSTTAPTTSLPTECILISDFSIDDDHSAWQIVNDDVMGGRSIGDRRFDDGRMIFEGSINTDGGGFSSLRRPLAPGTLEGMATIRVQADSDARTYMLSVEDALEGRSPRVSHRAVLEFNDDGRASVALPDLQPAVFGQPVDDLPVDPGLIDEIGLMVSDGIDGAFSISVDWVAGCP